MNLLFMLGNGFDLALGLETSYRAFYDWCWLDDDGKANPSRVKKDIYTPAGNEFMRCVRDGMKKCRDWSDFEKALELVAYENMSAIPGASPGINAANVIHFLQTAMYTYLKEQNALFLPPKDIQNEVCSVFVQSLYWMIKRYVGDETISSLDFLTFNYTNSLEKILGCPSETNSAWHVHGSIAANDMIVGIDGIKHHPFGKTMGEYYRVLVKSEQIKSGMGNNDREKRAKEVIEKSDLIVCYGLSFGDSDYRWWKCIRDSLSANISSRVLIVPYSRHINTILATNRMRHIMRCWQDRLIRGMCKTQKGDKTGLAKEAGEIEVIRHKILVADFNDCPTGDFCNLKTIGQKIGCSKICH